MIKAFIFFSPSYFYLPQIVFFVPHIPVIPFLVPYSCGKHLDLQIRIIPTKNNESFEALKKSNFALRDNKK